jgi:hypothetical protein
MGDSVEDLRRVLYAGFAGRFREGFAADPTTDW